MAITTSFKLSLYNDSYPRLKGENMMQGCPSGLLGNEVVELSEGLAQLKSEHPPLLNLLSELLTLCKEVEIQDDKAPLFLKLVEDVKSFSAKLEYHSTREEDYLFRKMEEYLGVGVGPIVVMEYEHEEAKRNIHQFFEKAKEQLSADEMIESVSLIINANYTLVNHFAKEENVLYPMAEKMLSLEEKKELKEKLCNEK